MGLLETLPRYELRGSPDVEVRIIELDSRRVSGGALFVCLEGLARNGHDFAATAVSHGACALLVRTWVEVDAPVTQVRVPDTREAMALLAAAFYGHPAREMRVIAVTGTNGKTSVTHILQTIARAAGERAEVMGTLGATTRGAYRSTGFTTPEAPVFQRVLREAADRGTRWMAVEVSSHALAQHRTLGTEFAAAIFTNLSRDHLDYHGTMDAYFEAKARLFTRVGRGTDTETAAVINLDDPRGAALLGRADRPAMTYGLSRGADVRATHLRTGGSGTGYDLVTPQGRRRVALRLVGRFNVLNALAAQAAALVLGLPLDAVAAGAGAVQRVSGRMEPVVQGQPFLVLVDFAHSPDALARALAATREVTRGRVLVVFGCGGDRDPGKRPQMGRVAFEGADRVILTSDNPRNEDPERILQDILAGIPEPRGVHMEVDRLRAIGTALESARSNDAVLIAGKGHETEQVIGSSVHPFDDRLVATTILRELGYGGDD